MEHISGRQFLGINVRGFRTNSQDDAENGYSLNGREISNFGKEFLQFELCACKVFGCESAGDTINTAMVGWCGGTSSWPVCQVESG